MKQHKMSTRNPGMIKLQQYCNGSGARFMDLRHLRNIINTALKNK